VTSARTDVLHSRTGTFADILDRRASAFSDVRHRGAGTRTDVFYGRTGALSYLTNGMARARTDVFYGRSSARAYIFDGRVEPFAYQVARSCPYVLDGGIETLANQLTGAGAYVLDGRVEALTHQVARTLSYIRNCGADTLYQLLDDLRVAVYGGEDPVQDGGHVVEPDLQERLRLNALDDQLDPAEVRIDANRQLYQVEHLREEVDLRPQVVQLEIDLVHLDHGHVEQNVGDLAVHHGIFFVVL
jgi:hypothetical protein